MSEKIVKTGIRREEGWLYYIDKKGNVARTRMMRGFPEQQRGNAEILLKTELNRETGWLYYIDKDGDVARVKMVGMDSASVQKTDGSGETKAAPKAKSPAKKVEAKKKIGSPSKKIMSKPKTSKTNSAKKKIAKKKR